ncbi:unnamed protein product, partial [Rotaria magnacalcarata]
MCGIVFDNFGRENPDSYSGPILALNATRPLQNLKRTVQQILKRLQNPLPLPENRNSLVIDSLFTKTNGNHTFLQYDSDPIDQCLLIFSTKKQLKMLE